MPARGHPQVSETKAAQIVALKLDGYSPAYIARRARVVRSTVSYVLKRFKEHHTLSPLPRSGRPTIVNDRTRRHILRDIVQNRFDTYAEVAARIPGVSGKTVQKVAFAAGYRRCVALTKPFLKPEMIVDRLEWAKENTGRDWNSAIWCDETSIGTGKPPGRIMVTRQPHEAYLPECLVSSYYSGRDSLMAWGAVAHGVKGPIVVLDMSPQTVTSTGRRRGGGLNARGYADQVVSGPLKDFWQRLTKERDREMFIVEDGAPSHKGKAVQKVREKLGMQRLHHPPNSPDLNPIEPIWYILKKRVAKIPGYRKNRESLRDAIKQAWDSIGVDEIVKHTGQMNARVEAVKQAKGGHTRF
ncbi:Transposable element Tc1 transposase [Ceratobasidium sp. AG-Ba]|nr:Transposable element Tc1 transposase [Ceratobasidium sp. AG-Ba]